MANERQVMEMLADTKTSLEEIQKQYKEMHNAFDLIEQRQQRKQVHTGPGKSDMTDTNTDTNGTSVQHAGAARETTASATDLTKTPDERGPESKQESETSEEHKTENILPQTDKRPRSGSTDDRKTKPKGILKKPENGAKQSYGFKERLKLDYNHVMYGSMLRRTAVEMHQDNRLCLKFGLQSNVGSVYESKRAPPDETEDIRSATENVKRTPAKENSYKREQTSSMPERKLVLRTPEADKRTTSGQRRARISSGPDSKPKPYGGRKTTEKKQITSKGQKQPTTVATSDSTTPMDELAAVMATGQGGALQQISRDDWVNVLSDGMEIEGIDKEQKKQMFDAYMDGVFGKEKTVNPAEVLNLSKDKFVDAAMNMMSGNLDLGETEKRFLVDNLVGQMFGKNGKLDLVKCAKVGSQFMSKGMKALTSAFTQGQEEERSESSESEEEQPKQTASQTRLLELKPRIEPTATEEDTEDLPQEDRVDIDVALWIQYANEEVQKGRVAQDVRERGMDTIICVDLSHSMRGIAWQQAANFIKKFMDGIQNSTLMDGVYEHVALVTYGSETRVQQHLTCDYLEIIRKLGKASRKLDRLKPSGTSPMYAGLQMVHASVLGAGAVFVSNGYKMHPRVFLITDGKATTASMIAGPDEQDARQSVEDELAILVLVREMKDKYHVTINPVPVGDFDLNILEKIANVSNGKIVSPEDWRMQSRVFKNNLAAAKVGGGPLTKLLAPGLATPAIARMMLDAMNMDASPEDKEQMDQFLRSHERDQDGDSDSQEIDDFPPLGSRVIRHVQGAAISTMSKQELGTVTKHMSDGHIGVTWDKLNANGSIREKIEYRDGGKGVTVVDEPRILLDEMIAEGCRVKRGKDWHYGNQDGGDGNLGNVYSVNEGGIVRVRWDNGQKNSYMYGASGKFDLEIVSGRVDDSKRMEDISKVEYTIPSDDESEDKRVLEMNIKNISIYDCVSSNGAEVEGATARPIENASLYAGETDKNRRNVTEIKEKTSNGEKAKLNALSSNENQSQQMTQMDILNRRNAANANVSDVKQGLSETHDSLKNSMANSGAKPKTGLMKQSGPQQTQRAQWMWQDGDTWKEYPPDVCEKIETDFNRNPRGTTLIRLNNIPFRVVFPRMEQVNIETKDKCTVRRNT